MKESELHEGRARIKVVGCGGGGGNAVNRMISKALKALRSHVDALIVVPNDRLAQGASSKTTLEEAFRMADDVLRQGVQGISDLVTQPGVINLDFADVKAIMENAGEALMGIGHGAGDSRAEDAAKQAVSSPLLETSIDGAKGILFNITAGKDITLQEVQRAAEIVRAAADPGANIIFGVVRDDTMAGEIKITVIATGFGGKTQQEARQETARRTIDRPELGLEELGDINIPAFLRNRM